MNNANRSNKRRDPIILNVFTKERILRHWRMARNSASAITKKINAEPNTAQRKALRLQRRFTIDVTYLEKLAIRQRERCFYTGKKLGKGIFTPALVRRDPQRGWVRGNVVWAGYPIALAKRHFTDPEFIGLARRVTTFAKDKHRPYIPIKQIKKNGRLGQGGTPHVT